MSSTIDRRSLALPHEICYRHLHAFRLAQTKLLVPTHHLSDTQWGLTHIDKCHHISTSSAVPSSRQNNANNNANNPSNTSATTNSSNPSKIGLHMTQTYRVRVCKTCCQESNHIELGTYMDQESAILVNDVFEIMNNRTDRLIVLTKEDRPYLHLIQMSRNSERAKNKDHVSVLELVAARMNALANHHNKLNSAQNSTPGTSLPGTSLHSNGDLASPEDSQKKRKQYHPIPLHQEADGSIKNFPGSYVGVVAMNPVSSVPNGLATISNAAALMSEASTSGSTAGSAASTSTTLKKAPKSSTQGKKNQLSVLEDFDSLSSAQALVQLSKPIPPTGSLPVTSPSTTGLNPSSSSTTLNNPNGSLNLLVNSFFSSPVKTPAPLGENGVPLTFYNSNSYVDDFDRHYEGRGFNSSGPSLKRQRSYTFSTSGDFTLSNFKDSYKHHSHDPVDKIGWLTSLDDDMITVAQTLFELSKKPVSGLGGSSSTSSASSSSSASSTVSSASTASTVSAPIINGEKVKENKNVLKFEVKTENTSLKSEIKTESSLNDPKTSLFIPSSPSSSTSSGVLAALASTAAATPLSPFGSTTLSESLKPLGPNGEFPSNPPVGGDTAWSRGMNPSRRGRSNSMSALEVSPDSSNDLMNYLLAASMLGANGVEGESLFGNSTNSSLDFSSLPSSFQFLKDTNSTLRPKDPLCIVLKKYLESGGRPGEGTIGIYPPEDRRKRLEKFFEKRKHRIWSKKVKYDVRKNFADSRIRIKGRFVKKEDEIGNNSNSGSGSGSGGLNGSGSGSFSSPNKENLLSLSGNLTAGTTGSESTSSPGLFGGSPLTGGHTIGSLGNSPYLRRVLSKIEESEEEDEDEDEDEEMEVDN